MLITVVGAGPAGSAAALAALTRGCAVCVFEKSRFPRHKVCGEFLSPEVAGVLDQLGAWSAVAARRPASIRRAELHIGTSVKQWKLNEPGFGLSRYVLDDLLLAEAAARGAEVHREIGPEGSGPLVIAHGRRESQPKGTRLFGFKAHFTGPVNDAVELYFFEGCYAGVSAVEDGRTNVCALAPEEMLRTRGFEPEAVLSMSPSLADRLGPLTREMDWLIAGPLVFRESFRWPKSDVPGERYAAGDALGFLDPFTGSGILAALLTGRMAGAAAADRLPAREHLKNCSRALSRQYTTAAMLRAVLRTGVSGALAPLVPGRVLFHLTRPKLV